MGVTRRGDRSLRELIMALNILASPILMEDKGREALWHATGFRRIETIINIQTFQTSIAFNSFSRGWPPASLSSLAKIIKLRLCVGFCRRWIGSITAHSRTMPFRSFVVLQP